MGDSPETAKPKTSKKSAISLQQIAIIFGVSLIGGIIGALIYSRVLASRLKLASPELSKQISVQESSAVIDVANKVSPSVVSIVTSGQSIDYFGQTSQQSGAGTGIIVTENGLILTNKHVVDSGDSFTVVTSDGKQFTAKVVAKDPANDLAFVQIDAHGLKPAELGDSDKVVVGQRVVAIGNALGQFQNTVTTGIISGKSRPISAGDGSGSTESLQNLLQTDAAINPGNSGGPLVNIDGQVIGINTAVAGGQNTQNIGFAIAINDAKSVIDSVEKDGKIIRPYLGVRYIPITADFAQRNGLNVTAGALVQGDSGNLAVVAGSPADKAGIQSGDIITSIGGKKIDANNDLTTIIAGYKVGDTVEIVYLRGSKEQKTKVTLQARPDSP